MLHISCWEGRSDWAQFGILADLRTFGFAVGRLQFGLDARKSCCGHVPRIRALWRDFLLQPSEALLPHPFKPIQTAWRPAVGEALLHILYYSILYYTLLYSTLLYSTLLYSTLLYYTILYYTILYHTILYYTILYSTILYYTILYYTILYYTILYYTILYYTVLYYTILYYTIL